MESSSHESRRQFLTKTSATAAVTAAATMSIPQWVHAAGTDETLRVGLIGCGGRGTQAAEQALRADPNAKLVAVGDTFKDRAEYAVGELKAKKAIADRVAVDPERIFSDFDNYKYVVDNSDVVLLATRLHFRPQHFLYAVEKGKHTFVEKPVAVDAPGVRHVFETCEMAKQKGLSVVSGLCWRYDFGVRKIMDRILNEQAIGEIIAIQSTYNSGALWHRDPKPGWSRMEYQLRNWIYYTWLSGDHIAEQAVHSLDKAAWLLGDTQPVAA